MNDINRECWRDIGELLGWVQASLGFGETSLSLWSATGSVVIRWHFTADSRRYSTEYAVSEIEIDQCMSIEALGTYIGESMRSRSRKYFIEQAARKNS